MTVDELCACRLFVHKLQFRITHSNITGQCRSRSSAYLNQLWWCFFFFFLNLFLPLYFNPKRDFYFFSSPNTPLFSLHFSLGYPSTSVCLPHAQRPLIGYRSGLADQWPFNARSDRFIVSGRWTDRRPPGFRQGNGSPILNSRVFNCVITGSCFVSLLFLNTSSNDVTCRRWWCFPPWSVAFRRNVKRRRQASLSETPGFQNKSPIVAILDKRFGKCCLMNV